jgi:apolipoprotein D and lipocalin family protein
MALYMLIYITLLIMKKKTIVFSILTFATALIALSSFKNKDKTVEVVKPFDQKRYLGKWFEIARLDYVWERNLDNVTATYSLREDGKILVDNKGYNFKKEKWEESIGKARPIRNENEGSLEVSFFGPFYAAYNVVEISTDYKYALVVGKGTEYLWILSREKTIPNDVKELFLKKAVSLKIDTNKLVWVKHNND